MNKRFGLTTDRVIVVFICLAAIIFGLVVRFLPEIYLKQGKDAYENQDYITAYNTLSKANKISKKNQDIRYYYAKTLTKLKPTLKIQKELYLIAESNINDSARLTATLKIAELKERFLKPFANNYIEQVPAEVGVVRWDLSSFPLKISIQKKVKGLPDYFETEIIRALNQWRESTRFVKYNIVDNTENANIIIEIVPMPKDVCNQAGCHYAVGVTTPMITNKGILHKMTITLYDKDPLGTYFTDKELYNTVLHEMGHALGIMGHSYNSNDLMYMADENSSSLFNQYRSGFQYLSQADLNTINLLYRMMPEVTNIALSSVDTKNMFYAPIIIGNSKTRSAKKLQEAENYIKKAPDLANGYIDKAIALSELNRVPEAIKALEDGLKIAKRDEDKYVINYNAAVIYLNNGMPSQGKPYALAAQRLSDTTEVQMLIQDIDNAIKQRNDILKTE